MAYEYRGSFSQQTSEMSQMAAKHDAQTSSGPHEPTQMSQNTVLAQGQAPQVAPQPPLLQTTSVQTQPFPSQPTYNQQEMYNAPQGQGYTPTGGAGQYQAEPMIAQQQYMSVMPITNLGPSTAPIQCPSCGQRVMTQTMEMAGNTTHAWAAGICFFTCLGCIAYAISGTKDVVHSCGSCHVRLATWHRSGRTEAHIHN